MKFLHAADIHIDSPLRGLERREGAPIDVIRRAPRDAFRALISLALEERVDFVILAGDIYDGDWRDVSTGLFFSAELARLGNIPVYIARGNHDAQSVITKNLRLPPNAHEFSAEKPQTYRLVIEGREIALHGQSYAHRAVLDDLAAGYPEKLDGCVNIGVLHTSLSGYAGHEEYAPSSLGTLLSKGYAYWALGHVHERQIVHDDPPVAYPGNIQGRHVHETGPKGCLIVSDDGRSSGFTLSFRVLDVVRWACPEVDAEGKTDTEAIILAMRDAVALAARSADGRTLCARVTLRGASPCHADIIARHEEIEAQLRVDADAYAWIESIRIETTPLRDPAALRETEGLLGDLFRSVEKARSDPERRAELALSLQTVREKIPLDVRRMFRTPLSADSENFAEIVNDAERILAAKVQA